MLDVTALERVAREIDALAPPNIEYWSRREGVIAVPIALFIVLREALTAGRG